MTTTETAAPAAPALSAPPRVERLPLAALRPSPKNPRRIRDDDPKLQEMVESLRTLGQISALAVRLVPADADGVHPEHYEVLAGHRRLRAAQLAGLPDLKCEIFDIDDATALEITVVENLQRADLHPLEEALGVATLLESGRSVEAIADRIGKSVRWVYLRAKLRDLVPQWRERLDDPNDIASQLSAGHLELIARMAPEVQCDLLTEREELFSDYGGGILPVADCAERIARQYLRELASAPWKLDDELLLVSAGPCTTCPKRSACQQELFADLHGQAKKPRDRCLDAGCWDSKRAAWLAQREAEAAEQHGEVVRVAAPGHLVRAGTEAPKTAARGAVPSDEVKEARPGERGAKPALIVSGPDQGKITWVKPNTSSYRPPSTATAKAFGLEKQSAAAGKQSADAAREKLRRSRAEEVDRLLLLALGKAPVPSLPVVAMLTWIVGVNPGTNSYEKASIRHWQQLGTAPKEPEIAAALWKQLVSNDDYGAGIPFWLEEDEKTSAPRHALAALAGVDLATLEAEALAKFPDPTPAKVTDGVKLATGADSKKPAKGKTAAKKPAKAKPAKPAKQAKATAAKKAKA